MTVKQINFKGSQGDKLSAKIDLPDNKNIKTFAIFAHCFTCNKNYKAVKYISQTLAKNDIAVLRFDFTGLGDSEGEFSSTNFSTNVADLIEANNYLIKEYQKPEMLIGHSLGGAASIQAAKKLDNIKAVVTIAAPYYLDHLTKKLKERGSYIDSNTLSVTIGGENFKLKNEFFEDLEKRSNNLKIDELDKPILIFHSPADTIVNIDQAGMIFKEARHPKSFISLDRSGHLLMNEDEGKYVGNVINAWSQKYL